MEGWKDGNVSGDDVKRRKVGRTFHTTYTSERKTRLQHDVKETYRWSAQQCSTFYMYPVRKGGKTTPTTHVAT